MKCLYNYNEKGFSLIEIMITLTIVGILSGFAIPAYMDWAKDARIARTKTDLKTLGELINKYELEQNETQKRSSDVLQGATVHKDEYIKGSETLKDKDIKAIVEQDSRYGKKQNNAEKFQPVRLRSLNELKGKYISNPEQLRDAWGQYFKVLPEVGQRSIQELLPGSKDKYKLYKEDAPTNPSTGEHPKIIYSCGPNGRDEKAKGDDIKFECRRFRYFESVSSSSDPITNLPVPPVPPPAVPPPSGPGGDKIN